MAILTPDAGELLLRSAVRKEIDRWAAENPPVGLWRGLLPPARFYRIMPIYVPWGKSIAHTKWWKRYRREQRRGQR